MLLIPGLLLVVAALERNDHRALGRVTLATPRNTDGMADDWLQVVVSSFQTNESGQKASATRLSVRNWKVSRRKESWDSRE